MIMDKLFNQKNFTVSLKLAELSEIVTTNQTVTLSIKQTCPCVAKRDYEIVTSDGNITKYDIIKFLNRHKYSPNCNHRFLEHIQYDSETNVVTFWFGS